MAVAQQGPSALDRELEADAGPALLDVRAVARLLGCSTRHVYRLTDSDEMPKPLKLRALVRWNRVEIEEWIAEGCPRRGRVRHARY